MAKRAAKPAENKVEIPLVEPEEKDGKTIATEQTTTVRTYARKVAVEPEPEPIEDDEPEEYDELEEEAEELDPVKRWLKDFEAQNSGNYEMVVYGLPNYPRDTRTNSTTRVRLGKRAFNPLTFEDDVAIDFARLDSNNWFVIEIRNNGRVIKTLPAMCILPASAEEFIQRGLPPPAPVTTATAPAAPVAVIDPVKQLRDTFALAKEAREAFGFDAQPQQQPPPPPAPVDDGLTPEERALAVMLGRNEKVLDKLANGALGKLFGNTHGDSAVTTLDIIKTGIEILPDVVKEIFAGMRQFREENNAATSAPTTQPNVATTTEAAEALAPASAQDQPPREVLLLDQMVRAFALNMPPSAAAGIVESYEAAFPTLTDFIGNFLNTPAELALQFTLNTLPQAAEVLARPGAAAWIEALQQELITSDEEEKEKGSADDKPS